LTAKELFAVHEFLLGIASRSFCAHSSQQTSTTRVPILTLIAFSSSLQSQAAQVFPAMITTPAVARSLGKARRPCRACDRCRNL
jgi:hypothetical protein